MTRNTSARQDTKPAPVAYPPLTKELALGYVEFHENGSFDRKGRCRIWRENGACQTWKSAKNAERFRQPVKHGLYAYGAITEREAGLMHVDETCPFLTQEQRDAAKSARLARQADSALRATLGQDADAGRIVWSKDVGWWITASGGLYRIRKGDNGSLYETEEAE